MMQINFTQQLIIGTLSLLFNLVEASATNLSTRVVTPCNLFVDFSKTQTIISKNLNPFSVLRAKKEISKETLYNSINDDG
jgi:hypothetical protein